MALRSRSDFRKKAKSNLLTMTGTDSGPPAQRRVAAVGQGPSASPACDIVASDVK